MQDDEKPLIDRFILASVVIYILILIGNIK